MKRIDIKAITKGQVFYECEMGMNAKLTALEDARVDDTGTRVRVEAENGEPFELFQSHRASQFALRLYDGPAYLTRKNA